VLLITGGYFAYVYYEKQKEKKMPPLRPIIKRPIPMPKARGPPSKQLRSTRMKEMLKKREEEKKAKRSKLFEKFGDKKPQHVKEIKKIKDHVKKSPPKEKEDVIERLKKLNKKTKQRKVVKEDAFKELKKIVKSRKTKKK